MMRISRGALESSGPGSAGQGWGPPPSQFPPRGPGMSRGYSNEMGAAYGSYTVSLAA